MSNVYSAFKPFYNLSKALGVFPKSFKGSTEQGKLETKWIDIASSILSVLFLLILILLIIFVGDKSPSTSPLLAQLWVIQIMQGLIFHLLTFIYQTSKCKSMGNFLSAIDHFDRKVSLKKQKIFHETSFFNFRQELWACRLTSRKIEISTQNSLLLSHVACFWTSWSSSLCISEFPWNSFCCLRMFTFSWWTFSTPRNFRLPWNHWKKDSRF